MIPDSFQILFYLSNIFSPEIENDINFSQKKCILM